MENVPTPTILDGDGSAGAWDAATLTFSNENSSGNATRPRFTFPVSTTGGKSYYISGRFSGDYTDVYRVSLGTVDGATTFVDGVFSGTASDAASGNLSIFLNGTLGPSAVTIESLSIREVIAAPTNVADGFVEGDYTRGGATPGLKGDGTSYLAPRLLLHRRILRPRPLDARVTALVTAIGAALVMPEDIDDHCRCQPTRRPSQTCCRTCRFPMTTVANTAWSSARSWPTALPKCRPRTRRSSRCIACADD
jgi:hypothetical protein